MATRTRRQPPREDLTVADLDKPIADKLLAWGRLFEAETGFEVRALDVGDDCFRLVVRKGPILLTADVDSLGRCTLLEERLTREEVTVGRRGDRNRVTKVSTAFVSRTRPEGARQMLRLMGKRVGSSEALRLLAESAARAGARRNPFSATAVVILDASARAAYASCWADRAEELGVALHGEIMDQAPPTSAEAKRWAEDLWTRIVDQNQMGMPAGTSLPENIEEIWGEAAARSDIEPDNMDEAREFGHYIAMEAMGTGVSWMDDHEKHGLKIPHDEVDPWALVPDADLSPVVNDDLLREAIEEAIGEDAGGGGGDDDDDDDDDDENETWELFSEYAGGHRPQILALRRLVDHLNYATAYVNEDLSRAYEIASVLLARSRTHGTGDA